MIKFAEFVYTVLCRPKPIRWLVNRILILISPESLSVRGAVIHLNHEDPILCGALTLGVFEKEEMDRFCSEVRDGITFVDVGANVGLYTALALRRMPKSGTILAVEPARENFLFLEKNISSNRISGSRVKVIAEPLAVADREGEGLLHKNPGNKGDNRLYRDAMLQDSEKVHVTTLDRLCARHGISQVEIIKMDVQGMEKRVLDGAKKILGSSRVCVLFLEFWAGGIERAGDSPGAIFEDLASMGFQIFEPVKKQLQPIEIHEAIRRTQGRKYMNLVARKTG